MSQNHQACWKTVFYNSPSFLINVLCRDQFEMHLPTSNKIIVQKCQKIISISGNKCQCCCMLPSSSSSDNGAIHSFVALAKKQTFSKEHKTYLLTFFQRTVFILLFIHSFQKYRSLCYATKLFYERTKVQTFLQLRRKNLCTVKTTFLNMFL